MEVTLKAEYYFMRFMMVIGMAMGLMIASALFMGIKEEFFVECKITASMEYECINGVVHQNIGTLFEPIYVEDRSHRNYSTACRTTK